MEESRTRTVLQDKLTPSHFAGIGSRLYSGTLPNSTTLCLSLQLLISNNSFLHHEQERPLLFLPSAPVGNVLDKRKHETKQAYKVFELFALAWRLLAYVAYYVALV
jgi:hypothetical protein